MNAKCNNNTQELVINWHLTEACNYRCEYCFAKWDKACPRELIHDPQRTSLLLEALYRFFQPGNQDSPLAQKMTWNCLRLNLAGGEPLLYDKRFLPILVQARTLGFEVSLITNASKLTRKMLDSLAPHLTWLGISLDSQKPFTNKAIGRIDKDGHMLNVDRLKQDIEAVRQCYPRLRLKVNTVVNHFNHHEYLGDLISRISPDKWKVLRMLPILDGGLQISSTQFSAFVDRHKEHSNILVAEDNLNMCESYLMIDPHGRFFQNNHDGLEAGYSYSQKILEVGAEAAFSEMKFDAERFGLRYRQNLVGDDL